MAGDVNVQTEIGNNNDNVEFRWPVKGCIIQSFLSDGNDGINIAVPEGTLVRAAEARDFINAGEKLAGYGKMGLFAMQAAL